MATRRSDSSTRTAGPAYIEVAGFKSISPDAPARLHLRGLTLLAGANSSGKSAIMQPLLLMKQTMEAPYDPGPLLLDGPHVEFTAVEQMVSRRGGADEAADGVTIEVGPLPTRPGVETPPLRCLYSVAPGTSDVRVLAPPRIDVELESGWVTVDATLSAERVLELIDRLDGGSTRTLGSLAGEPDSVEVGQIRLGAELSMRTKLAGAWISIKPLGELREWLARLLHLPGLRGHRERSYRVARARRKGPIWWVEGPFTPYVASLLMEWQESGRPDDEAALARVGRDMRRMTLTSCVHATRPNATHLELKVGRTLDAAPDDLVDIADVGFGVSQVLPVVVALAAAAPGQPVYIEQPELHLHPRAQFVMGQLLVEAVRRGVTVIVETHSRMILRAIQTEVARRAIAPEDVGLHWFSRDPDTGATRVDLAELDADGAFGEWPVDFSEAEAEADDAWLEAVLDRQS